MIQKKREKCLQSHSLCAGTQKNQRPHLKPLLRHPLAYLQIMKRRIFINLSVKS